MIHWWPTCSYKPVPTLFTPHKPTHEATLTDIGRFSCLWCLLDSRLSLPLAVSTQAHPCASVWSLNSHLGCILLLFIISLQQFLLFIQSSYWGALAAVHCCFTSCAGQSPFLATVHLSAVCLSVYTCAAHRATVVVFSFLYCLSSMCFNHIFFKVMLLMCIWWKHSA